MRKTHIGFACVTKSDWSGGCFWVAIQDAGGTNIKWFQCIDQKFEPHVLQVWFRVKHCFVLSISVAFYGSQKEHLTKSASKNTKDLTRADVFMDMHCSMDHVST